MLGDSRADAPLVLLTCSLPVPPRFAWPMPIPTTVERTVTQASRFKRGPRSADFGQRGVPVGRVQASVRATQRTGVAQPPDEHKSLLEHDLQTTPHWARTSNLRFRRPMLYPIELGVRTCHAANRQDARARPNKAAIAAMHESNHITDRQRSEGACEAVLAHPPCPPHGGPIMGRTRWKLRFFTKRSRSPLPAPDRMVPREAFAKTRVRHARPDGQAWRASQRGTGMSRRLNTTPAST